MTQSRIVRHARTHRLKALFSTDFSEQWNRISKVRAPSGDDDYVPGWLRYVRDDFSRG
jgi:hypothetical protein